jgi:hypothetical protein
MTEITQHHDENDDGFSGSLIGGRLIKGQILRWNETNGWTDRDGLRPPELLLALAISEALQCWKGKRPVETITAKRLPDIDTLNAAVPKAEWEFDLTGQPKPPWVHQMIVYLVDPEGGGFFTYLNSTIGAHIAVEELREKVITVRALRGAHVVPVVRLSHRPMKTKFGMKHRPEFEIAGWRGGPGNALSGPPTPQLGGPAPAASSTPLSAADATLAAMEEVTEPSFAEKMNDSVRF